MITPNANKTFNEVASAEMLLGYAVVNTGCCKVQSSSSSFASSSLSTATTTTTTSTIL
jgi:hypothetical protein